jgi:hypothetical protein
MEDLKVEIRRLAAALEGAATERKRPIRKQPLLWEFDRVAPSTGHRLAHRNL